FQQPAVKFQVRMDIFELDAGGRSQSVALALGALEVQSKSPPPSRSGRTQARRCQGRVEPGPQLVGIKLAALFLVPLGKPFLTERAEFFRGEFAVLVGVASLKKGRRHEHCRAKPARSAEATGTCWTTARAAAARPASPAKKSTGTSFRFHGFPLLRGELQVHGPDVRSIEKLRRLRSSLAGPVCDREQVEESKKSRQEKPPKGTPPQCCDRLPEGMNRR